LRAHGAQIVRDRRDAIGFFNAQFLRIPDGCFAARQNGCDGQNRQFVNELWHFFPLNNRGS
jgi:hypothetical protein